MPSSQAASPASRKYSLGGVNGGIAAGEQHPVEFQGRQGRRGQFGDGERQQVGNAHAPGERLRDVREQPELLGAGEHEAARDPHLVDHALEPGKEVRPALGLVEDRARGEPRQETPGVLLREGALGGVLQADIGPVGEERAGERGLAGLARAGQGEDREAGRQAAQRGFESELLY